MMIIAIDPGITHCGLSVLTKHNDEVIVEETQNVKGNIKLRGPFEPIGEKYGLRAGRVLRIAHVLDEMLDKYPDVDEIAVEAPFYNRARPVAFASLLEVVYALKHLVAIPRNKKFELLAPMLVKKYWYGKGNAKKEHMEEAFHKRIKDGNLKFNYELEEELTEHEIDSIAVGRTYFFSSPEEWN